MENRYKLRSRKDITQYLRNHENYYPLRSWNGGFVISWNVKIHNEDSSGKSGYETISPSYDAKWQEHIKTEEHKLFWQACEDVREDMLNDRIDNCKFRFSGSSGGHLWLSDCDVVTQPRTWKTAPFIFANKDAWFDYLDELSFPDLRKLYRVIAGMDRDFTRSKITAEINHYFNRYRFDWELEQEAEQTTQARTWEGLRPDMYAYLQPTFQIAL